MSIAVGEVPAVSHTGQECPFFWSNKTTRPIRISTGVMRMMTIKPLKKPVLHLAVYLIDLAGMESAEFMNFK